MDFYEIYEIYGWTSKEFLIADTEEKCFHSKIKWIKKMTYAYWPVLTLASCVPDVTDYLNWL